MAIASKYDLNTLAADLTDGGFWVREIKTVQLPIGQIIELYLSNGSVFCWNPENDDCWAEGPLNRTNELEDFFLARQSGSVPFRWLMRKYNHSRLRVKRKLEKVAFWLLRSDIVSAQIIRRLIMCLPQNLLWRRSRTHAAN